MASLSLQYECRMTVCCAALSVHLHLTAVAICISLLSFASCLSFARRTKHRIQKNIICVALSHTYPPNQMPDVSTFFDFYPLFSRLSLCRAPCSTNKCLTFDMRVPCPRAYVSVCPVSVRQMTKPEQTEIGGSSSSYLFGISFIKKVSNQIR